MDNIIPRQEHPRPDRHRNTWLNLNGEWDFDIVKLPVAAYVFPRIP